MYKNGCVSVGDTDMYYVAFGKGKKKLVVLPGLSDGLATVKGKALLLAPPYNHFLKKYTVYMFSRKNGMQEGYSMEDMAEDQVLAMKNLGIMKASVLGVSQGGMVAQCIAIHHPEVVEKLILAVTAPNANEVVQDVVSDWMHMAMQGDHTGLMADTAEKMYSDHYLQKNRKLIHIMARFTKPKSYNRFLINAHAILGFDVREELDRITCPTYIIAGRDDRTVGNEAPHILNESIQGSRLYLYPGLGHGLFDEAKDFYDKVFEFCNA